MIPISEVFGPTIQGEGHLVGLPTVFVRTGGCDYRCAWCDTLYAVLPEYKHTWPLMSAEEIMSRVEALSSQPILITFSGGNPAMHDLGPVIDLAQSKGYTCTIETQGSIPQTWFKKLDHMVFSPKPPSSLMKTDWDLLDECYNEVKYDLTPERICFKVVVSDETDYAYAKKVFEKYPDTKHCMSPCNISPGAPDLEAVYEKTRHVVDMVLKDGLFNVSVIPQLHVLLWGNTRGI